MNKYRYLIKECRESKGLTQEQLSELIGVSRSHLSKIENGKIDISLSLLWNIGQALEVCPHRLLDYDCNVNCAFNCKIIP